MVLAKFHSPLVLAVLVSTHADGRTSGELDTDVDGLLSLTICEAGNGFM